MERGLHDEHAYDLDSRERALSRRRLLQLGGASLLAASIGPAVASRAWADVPGIVKPTPDSLFVERGTNAEMRWEAMRGQGYLTPTDRFFVRNHTDTPVVDRDTWRLRVHGTGVRRELSVSSRRPARPAVGERHPLRRVRRQRPQLLRQPAGHPRPRHGLGPRRRRGRPLDRRPPRRRARPRGRDPAALDVMPVGLVTRRSRSAGRCRWRRRSRGHPAGLRHERPHAAGRPRLPGAPAGPRLDRGGQHQVGRLASWSPTAALLRTGTRPATGWSATPTRPTPRWSPTQVGQERTELPLARDAAARPAAAPGRSWSGHGGIARVEVSIDGGRRGSGRDLDGPDHRAGLAAVVIPCRDRPGPGATRCGRGPPTTAATSSPTACRSTGTATCSARWWRTRSPCADPSRAQLGADPVEVPEHGGVRRPGRRLRVGHPAPLAEPAHHPLRVRPGAGRGMLGNRWCSIW